MSDRFRPYMSTDRENLVKIGSAHPLLRFCRCDWLRARYKC